MRRAGATASGARARSLSPRSALTRSPPQVWITNPGVPRPRGPGAEPDDADPDPCGRSEGSSSPVFLLGEIEDRLSSETVAVQLVGEGGHRPTPPKGALLTRSGALQTHVNDVFLACAESLEGAANLVDLDFVSEATVVRALTRRLGRGERFTWLGDSLVAIDRPSPGEDSRQGLTARMLAACWATMRRDAGASAAHAHARGPPTHAPSHTRARPAHPRSLGMHPSRTCPHSWATFRRRCPPSGPSACPRTCPTDTARPRPSSPARRAPETGARSSAPAPAVTPGPARV